MANRTNTNRPIILSTIYKNESEPMESVLVTTYKIDPKGEEFFASRRRVSGYNLKDLFVNRVISVAGIGTHIPLINSRIMMDAQDGTTSLAHSINPYPRTDDYKNPYERRGDNGDIKNSRISVGKTSRVNFVSEHDSSRGFTTQEVRDILGEDAELLPRRHRTLLTSSNVRKEFEKARPSGHDVKPEKKRSDDSTTEKTSYRDPGAEQQPSKTRETKKVITYLPNADWIEENKDTESQEEIAIRKDIHLRKCLAVCVQHNLIYPPQRFSATVKDADASTLFNDIFMSLEKTHSKIPEPKIEKLYDMKVILVSRNAKILGAVERCERIRGLEIEEDSVGMIVIDDKLM